MLYGLAMIAFGLSHFVYLNLTEPLVPKWLPAPVFWAYFTGGAFLAAGAAVLTGRYARLAATLATVQIGLFTLLIWVPLVLAGNIQPGPVGRVRGLVDDHGWQLGGRRLLSRQSVGRKTKLT